MTLWRPAGGSAGRRQTASPPKAFLEVRWRQRLAASGSAAPPPLKAPLVEASPFKTFRKAARTLSTLRGAVLVFSMLKEIALSPADLRKILRDDAGLRRSLEKWRWFSARS